MTSFLYSGKTLKGKDVDGEITASSIEDARALLRKRRILTTKIGRKPFEIKLNLSKGVPIKDLARFTRQFATMNSAGLPLIQCLETMVDQVSNVNLKEAVKKISTDIQSGHTLADAFGRHPKVFSDLYCHMLSAGEAGGILDLILFRLADYQEKSEKLLRKIRGAMMYPSFVMLVAIFVVIVLLWKVVPTFAKMFTSAGAELPLPTQLIMQLSGIVQNYFAYIIGTIFLIPFAVQRYYKTSKGHLAIDTLVLKLPGVGELIRKSNVARFTQTLGTLLGSGIPIIDALRITAKTAGNRVLENGIISALDSISSGQTISTPLKATGILPPMVIQMVAIGEKTGKLAEMLEKISEFYSDEVDTAVDNLTSLIEPVIIVFLGGVVAVVLIAMYLPMFSMATTM